VRAGRDDDHPARGAPTSAAPTHALLVRIGEEAARRAVLREPGPLGRDAPPPPAIVFDEGGEEEEADA
jgi:hypothetical protein